MKRLILYYGLLSKRFLKKKSFLLILCAIPLLAFFLELVSHQDSGILRIVLCAEDLGEEAAVSVIQNLTKEDSVLQFIVMEDKEQAGEAVTKNKADAAWIFSEHFGEYLDAFAKQGYLEKPAVMIYEREDTVALELARLKLFGAMSPKLIYTTYCHFEREEIPGTKEVPDDILREAYDGINVEGNLFCLAFRDGEDQRSLDNYLTAPVRGMLSLMILLCGFAAVMYFLRDEEQGMFQGISERRACDLVGVYALAAMVPAALICLVTLGLLGQLGQPPWECLIMVLFVLINSTVCMLLKRLLPSIRIMGACIPFFMLALFALCPVFVSIRAFRKVQYLLPPYYYLNTIQNRNGVWGMVIYLTAGVLLILFLRKIRGKRAIHGK